jgi:hypothetical protein
MNLLTASISAWTSAGLLCCCNSRVWQPHTPFTRTADLFFEHWVPDEPPCRLLAQKCDSVWHIAGSVDTFADTCRHLTHVDISPQSADSDTSRRRCFVMTACDTMPHLFTPWITHTRITAGRRLRLHQRVAAAVQAGGGAALGVHRHAGAAAGHRRALLGVRLAPAQQRGAPLVAKRLRAARRSVQAAVLPCAEAVSSFQWLAACQAQRRSCLMAAAGRLHMGLPTRWLP